MSNGYRTLSQHLNDLKKENFSLKLRIYFLEERVQQKYEDSSEDVYRRNIELKVEVESLKQELLEKQQLLDKALTTAESVTNHNEAELQRRCEERQQEIDHMQEILETKIQLLQEEAKLARSEAERMATLAGTGSLRGPPPGGGMKDASEEGHKPPVLPEGRDRVVEELTRALRSKEALIAELTDERGLLQERVGHLESQVQDLSASLQQKERDAEFFQDELGREKLRIQQEMQNLIEEQQTQLNQYECAAGQCVSELQKAQLQVQSLQAKIQESETNNQRLQEKLCEMESDLRSIRMAAQRQERTIQGLSETVSTKDSEAEELYRVIEGQNDTLCKLREMAHRNQLQQVAEEGQEPTRTPALQSELLALQNSLFSTQLELESSQRAHHRSERQAANIARARDRLQGDLQEVLQQREVTEQHNQELRRALQQARCELQLKEGQLKDKEAERQMEMEERDDGIRQLRLSLQDKERLLQEYSELLDQSQDPSRPRDALVNKLRERIKDRDRALERSIDEKFRCLEEKETEVRRLQLALREKERDLERLRCILSNNEETITSLEGLLRGKELGLEQVSEACRNLQWQKQEMEERQGRSLREREAIISQLQASLQTRTKEAEDLEALLSKGSMASSEVVEELRLSLQLKERLFQEILADRNQQAQEHHAEVQELLNTISTRDQYIKDSAGRLSQLISERTSELQELRRQLIAREREARELSREREPCLEVERLQNQLREKESFIQELMKSQEEPMVISTPGEATTEGFCEGGAGPQEEEREAEREELQLVLRKEKEAQLEISTLHSALAKEREVVCALEADVEALSGSVHAKEDLIKDLQRRLVKPSNLPLVEQLTKELQELRDNTKNDHQQHILEQLVSEYSGLNTALRTETELYRHLTQTHPPGEGLEKTLQKELEMVQALRGQLEEVLARTRDFALVPERAAKKQPDFGELSTDEEEEEDDASSEFTDSIEEDDNKLTARTLATTLNAGITCEQEDLHGGPVRRILSQDAAVEWQVEMQKLVEQKRAVERELGELKAQLEKSGFSSLSQMRNALLHLQLEKGELKGAAGHVTWRGWEQGVTGGLSEEGQQQGSSAEGHVAEEGDVPGLEATRAREDEVGPAQGKRGAPYVPLRERQGKRRCTRPHSQSPCPTQPPAQEEEPREDEGQSGFWEKVEAGLREQALRLRSELALSRQESHDLQERLMVSEATVQAQAEQLKDYRELLTETSVEQASKQVQVDLQDLGYETCGRSENEAERDETSSPEFDDMETSGRDRGGQWWAGEWVECEDAAALRRRVRELRTQLARSQKAVRSLQLRVRSLSATSDYASSLERVPRKVNWAFRASDEDEGWQSDGAGRHEPQPSRALRELVTRVTSLEAQLKHSCMEGKATGEDSRSATWPGKYDTLIQAQARELSHLRQAMREGRGICHILTQHLGDTTKAFEELLRANDVDYYASQSFRQQLAQSTALAERVAAKISGRDCSGLHDEKMGHELLALRLSKELQQKDKIIESLHTKLQQHSDTPSSSHALSETTDQSDRTSFVSDEQGSTNEDLELCSDMDGASEYAHEEQGRRVGPGQIGTDLHHHSGTPPQHLSIPSSTTASHGTQSSCSCPTMPCTLHGPAESEAQKDLYSGPVSSSLPVPFTHYCPKLSDPREPSPFDPHSPLPGPGVFSLAEVHEELQLLQRQLGESFAGPHVKALANFPSPARSHPDSSSYLPLSHHAFHQPKLASTDGSSKVDGSPLESSALWDMGHTSGPVGVGTYGTVSSGSSGYRSGVSYTGADLIEEHLREIRGLRQRLEDSIRTNERLRQQLEERLATTGRHNGAPTNIYIQGLESLSQLTNENQALKEEILGLQARLQASRDSCQEAEQLREAVLTGRAQLKQAELEAEEWKEELRRLQAHSCKQGQEIQQLRQDRQNSQENNNRLQHEVNLLQQQLSESRQLLHSLQCELQVYDRMCGHAKGPHAGYGYEVKSFEGPSSQELGELLAEVRGLRVQLEQQLGVAIGHRMSVSPCKRLLFHDPAPSPPVRDMGLFNTASPYTMLTDQEEAPLAGNDPLNPHAALVGEAPDGSFANKNGRHAVGHVDDFSALQQQVLEGKALVSRMQACLLGLGSGEMAVDCAGVAGLLANAKTLRQILEEAASLLKMFWRAALPDSERFTQHAQKEQDLMEEIHQLKQKVGEQEELLQGTVARLRSTNRTKESMEHFIISQLSRTRDVLKKAKSNLQKNERKISSLNSSSSSLCPAKGMAHWPPLPVPPPPIPTLQQWPAITACHLST
ncbi:myomegalin-like isoform X2 [Megalops cyprinoides]|uniref:myomegalin-like isoform X2 n=1 Tax=Megalops cyprinoides TaxID=118141 RepID=UPI0018643C0E|nr:myomegalin-like isoform X2 [Megalops cyprinoides]